MNGPAEVSEMDGKEAINEKDELPLTHVLALESFTSPLPLERWFKTGQPLELEVGCGNGRFLATRAQRNPGIGYIGIERLLGRVRRVNRKAVLRHLDNLYVLRLEAFYTFYYLLPRHRLHAVYVFFPDPWPKHHHHCHRLFTPSFLDTLWARLEIGGEVQIATDDAQYYEVIRNVFTADKRFTEIPAIERDAEEQTDFEKLFRGKNLPIFACGYKTLPAEEPPLLPLRIPPEMEPRPDRKEDNGHSRP